MLKNELFGYLFQKLKNYYEEIIKMSLALYFCTAAFNSRNNEAKISQLSSAAILGQIIIFFVRSCLMLLPRGWQRHPVLRDSRRLMSPLWLECSCPPQIRMWNTNPPKVMVVGGEDFGRWPGREDGAPWLGLVLL